MKQEETAARSGEKKAFCGFPSGSIGFGFWGLGQPETICFLKGQPLFVVYSS